MVVLDVNETLSDLSPLDEAFTEVGLAAHERQAWFAGVLRDGFGLGLAGASAPFAEVAAGLLRARLLEQGVGADDAEGAVEHVMGRFGTLTVHRDVGPGIRALRAAGPRVVTLSNGSAGVAEGLLDPAAHAAGRAVLTDRGRLLADRVVTDLLIADDTPAAGTPAGAR